MCYLATLRDVHMAGWGGVCQDVRAHFLVDPPTGHVTGILDWADAIIGDPFYDVATLSMGGPAGGQIQDVLQPRLIAA